MTKDEALKQALKALEQSQTKAPFGTDRVVYWQGVEIHEAAIAAVKEALAQTEQKINHAETERIHPFKLAKGEKGVITYSGNGSAERRDIEAPTGYFFQVDKRLEEDDDIQDYKKPWVGLTFEERNEIWRKEIGWGDPSHNDEDLMKAIEAKLKDRNT